MHRRRDLDLLRAAAVLLVLFFHMPPLPAVIWSPVRTAFAVIARSGWAGVDLFFVLSGFLVSGLLFKEYQRFGAISWRNFFVRRGFKIYPLFYLFLLVTSIGQTRIGNAPRALSLFCEALFIQNYGPGLWVHTWSLGVEEHFYLLLPALLIVLVYLSRHSPAVPRAALMATTAVGVVAVAATFALPLAPPQRNVPIGMATLFTLAAAWLTIASRAPKADRRDPFGALPRLVLFAAAYVLAVRTATTILMRHPPYDAKVNLFPTHLRVDALLWGALISYLYHFHRDRLRSVTAHPLMLVLSALCIAPSVWLDHDTNAFAQTVGMTLLYLGFGGVIARVAVNEPPSSTRRAPIRSALAYVGVCSYSIYLWHVPILYWLPIVFDHFGVEVSELGAIGAYLAASIIVGIVMAALVERPALAVRDRWFPSRSIDREPAPRVYAAAPEGVTT